ncbi:MAG: efflux RND transporter periplasmic adaptor subunit [Pseudomonadota bacterium]
MNLRLLLLALAAVSIVSASPNLAAQEQAPPLPAVTVVVAEEQDVTPKAEFIGRIEAVARVDLRARVTGFLEEQAFEDGATVSEGDLLFVIEQAPFAAEVKQAEANLAAAQAQAENAQVALERAQTLLERDTVAEATVDDRRAESRVADAAVLQAEAALEQARITYSYTEIKAPITGRIDRATIKPGNLVSPESGVLTVIVQQDPAYIVFSLTDRMALNVRRAVAASEDGQDVVSNSVTLSLRLSDGTMYDQTGTADFAGVEVNPGTDTVVFRGVIPNPNGVLLDRQFVVVVVELAEPQRRLVVPQSAVSVDQRGQFVLVVDDEDTVAPRFITTGDNIDSRVVVEGGLEPGSRVIVDGLMKVRPGMKVSASVATES